MNHSIRKAALQGASALSALAAFAAPAMAQTSVAAAPAACDTSDIQANCPPAEQNAIVVTGSRIARPEADTASPVVVVTAASIQQSGTANLTDYLTKIPALSGSSTAYDNSGNRANIGTTGLNLLNLRNLGTDRTLVLIDGRRQVASVSGTQAVDINTIPEDLIERVEVLTGGASAIYGADGVTGVVNFIQKKNFEGLTGRVQAGISSHGDAGQRMIALTAGHNFADGRGNIAMAWEHSEEDRLDSHQRSEYSGENKVGFYLNSADTEKEGQNNDGIPDYIPLKNVRYNDTSREGGIDVNFDGIPDFYGAQGLPYDPGTPVPTYYQQGGSGTLISDYGSDLRPEVHRDIFNALAHFDVSPALTIYAEGKYARTRSYSLGQPTWDYYLLIPSDNPYIPSAVKPFVDPDSGVLVNRDNFDLGQRGEDITRKTIRTVLGAKGEIAPNLSYDLSWVYGQTKVANHYVNNILSDRFYAAIDAVSNGSGGITCRANLDAGWTPNQPYTYVRPVISPTTFAAGDGSCQPLDLFGQNIAGNKAAIDWITADTTDYSKLTQNVVSGALTGNSGSYFNLPGGPVGFALGGEYRRETSSFTADPLSQQGLTFSNSLGNTTGKFDVWEAFGELNVPVLKDMPFAHRLDFDGAYRYSKYSTVGSTSTWKLGGNWAPVRDITFRGTYSKAVRAPNISELYSASSQIYQFINDPCGTNYLQNGTQYRVNNCQALLSGLGVSDPSSYNDPRSSKIPGYSGGNPNVKEETAKTWTAGVVLQPSFIRGLLITADWYDIKIKNAINTVDAQTIADLCVDQPTLENQYCSAIVRENGGATPGIITSFTVSPLNVADFSTNGLDVSIDYQLRTAKAGTFGIHAVGSYLHRLTYVPIPGAVEVNDAQQPGSPKYQVVTDLSWQGKKVLINWRVNYASAVYRYTNQTIQSNPDIVAPEYLKYKRLFSHDVYVSADVNDRFSLYGGVNNVFNQKPSIGASDTPISAVGRYFFVGAKIKLADAFGGAR